MSTIAKIDGIAIANIAKIDGIAKANISKVDGIDMGQVWGTPSAIHSKCGEDAPHLASYTIDGDTATWWNHLVEHEHWIIFDLGSTMNIDKIRIYGAPANTFILCGVSAVYINDTADESGGSKGSGSIGDGWNEIDVTNTSGRYIKLKLEAYDGSDICNNLDLLTHFHEFQYSTV